MGKAFWVLSSAMPTCYVGSGCRGVWYLSSGEAMVQYGSHWVIHPYQAKCYVTNARCYLQREYSGFMRTADSCR